MVAVQRLVLRRLYEEYCRRIKSGMSPEQAASFNNLRAARTTLLPEIPKDDLMTVLASLKHLWEDPREPDMACSVTLAPSTIVLMKSMFGTL